MPHVVIEHHAGPHDGFDPGRALALALETAAATGIMRREDIKVRLRPAPAILFGDGRTSFVHVEVSLLAGRPVEARLALSDALVLAMRAAFPGVGAISADIREMEPGCYRKSLSGGKVET